MSQKQRIISPMRKKPPALTPWNVLIAAKSLNLETVCRTTSNHTPTSNNSSAKTVGVGLRRRVIIKDIEICVERHTSTCVKYVERHS
jgi:hypothetical protein